MRGSLISLGIKVILVGSLFAITPLINGDASILYDYCVEDLRTTRGIIVDCMAILCLSVGAAILYIGIVVRVMSSVWVDNENIENRNDGEAKR